MGGGSSTFVMNSDVEGQGPEIMDLKKQLRLKDHELNKYWTAFCKVDNTCCGTVSLERFHTFYKLDQTPFSMKVFSIMDNDGSGGINFHEFVLAIWNYLSLDVNSLARFSFKLYDTDSSQVMEKMEVEAMVACVYGTSAGTNDRVSKVLEKLQPEDGRSITCDEFIGFSKQYPLLLYPAFVMQNVLRRHIFGEAYWEAISVERARNMSDKTIFDILKEEAQVEKKIGRDTPQQYFKELESRSRPEPR